MPKIKTRNSAKSRVKITGAGKVLRKKIGTSHLKRKKSANAKHRDGNRKLPDEFKTRFKNMLHKHAKDVDAE